MNIKRIASDKFFWKPKDLIVSDELSVPKQLRPVIENVHDSDVLTYVQQLENDNIINSDESKLVIRILQDNEPFKYE